MKRRNPINVFDMQEKDIIDFILKSNNDHSLVIPVVLKGLSSTLAVAAGVTDVLSLGLTTKLLNISKTVYEGVIKTFNDKPKEVLRTTKLFRHLRAYYGNFRAGENEYEVNENPQKAIDYYKISFRAADKIFREYRNAFEKKTWLCDLFQADALSFQGSMNTAIRDFEAGKMNFEESLKIIDGINKKNDVTPADRAIEIASYCLSNDLRDRKSTERFLQNSGIEEYDHKFGALLNTLNEKQERFTYRASATGEIINYLRENYKDKGKYSADWMDIAQNINNLMSKNHACKISRAIGKYYTIRGCYDFIQLKFNMGDNEKSASDTEEKILKGLECLTKSHYHEKSVEAYLLSDNYCGALQRDFGRNFTLLYGLGYFLESSGKMNTFLRNLRRAYRKETPETEKNFFKSVNVSLEQVLKPFHVVIDRDEFFDKIKTDAPKKL